MACLILPITADDLFQHKGGVLAVRQGFFLPLLRESLYLKSGMTVFILKQDPGAMAKPDMTLASHYNAISP